MPFINMFYGLDEILNLMNLGSYPACSSHLEMRVSSLLVCFLLQSHKMHSLVFPHINFLEPQFLRTQPVMNHSDKVSLVCGISFIYTFTVDFLGE